MSATQEREQQLVRGTVTSLLVKGNDSWQIVVRPDNSQYDKKIWTKDAALIQQINASGIGQRFDFLCNASYWTNQQNQQVRSLWYEAIAAYGTLEDPAPVQQAQGLPGAGLPGVSPAAPVGLPLPGQTAPLAPPQPAQGLPGPQTGSGLPQPQVLASDPNWESVPPVVKEARILRQTAMKCAVHMLPYLSGDMQSISGLEYVAERFVAYFMGGPQDEKRQREFAAQAQGQQPLPTDDETPPDWVQQDGPVPADYQAGSEDAARAYTGGFPS